MGKHPDGKPRKRPQRPKAVGKRDKLTPAAIVRIHRQWLQGNPVAGLADEYGVTRGRVYQVVHEFQGLLVADNQRTRDDILSELAMVRSVAWRKFQESESPITEERVESVFGWEPVKDKKTGKETLKEGVQKKLVTIVRKRTGESQWLEIVRWAIEQECRIRGIYQQDVVSSDIGLRYAGSDPEEIDDQMVARMAAAIAKRREIVKRYGLIPPPIEAKFSEPQQAAEQPTNGKAKPLPTKQTGHDQ